MLLILADRLLINFYLLKILTWRKLILLCLNFYSIMIPKIQYSKKTCFKSTNNPICVDLFVTYSSKSFQNTVTFSSGLSDFHKMILTILKSTFPKVRPKQIVYKKFKNFDLNNFKNEIRTKMQSIDKYETFEEELKY